MGGELINDMEINRIESAGDKFTVSTLAGESFSGSKVISSMNPAKTLEMMDPALFRRSYTRRIMGLKNTVSSFALYIVLKEKSFRYLNHNYYYHVSDEIKSPNDSNGWPFSYLLQTPSASPDGFAKSMIILTSMQFSRFAAWENTLTGDRGGDYTEFKEKCACSLLDLAEKKFPGIRAATAYMEISTPLTWRDYTGTPEGSMYGVERNCHEPLGTTILPVTKIPGFFFTGQNSNIHGVLGVTIGAVLTCSEILGQAYLLTKINKA
jgi:all-trans-retinol 13,14-reductase